MMKYIKSEIAGFLRTKDRYGLLSNFAGGFPITINDRVYRTSEALYQCARFPYNPEIQQEIIDAKSPMTAKMIAKKYKELTRPDWHEVRDDSQFRLQVMSWALYAKWWCNFDKFTKVLLETEHLPIVEISNKDDFWGAKPQLDGSFVGQNILGIMLTQMRDYCYAPPLPDFFNPNSKIMPVNETDFLFFNEIPRPIMISPTEIV